MRVTDELGRSFKTLRLSLTDECNFSCYYCVYEPKGGYDWSRFHPTYYEKLSAQSTSLSLNRAQLTQAVAQLHHINPLHTVRLTGGEPLLFKDVDLLVHDLKQIGIRNVKLTTNASLLASKVDKLVRAGLDEINISLDAVNLDTFQKVTRNKHLPMVIKGILAAKASGLPIKINAVIMKGINHREVVPLLQFGEQHGITVRYIELMKMGPLHSNANQYFYGAPNILNDIAQTTTLTPLERTKSATANYWQTGSGATFGIIANESHPFCKDCNRLRLDSKGYLYGCLSNPHGFSIRAYENEPQKLRQLLQKTLSQKQLTHFTGSKISMQAIGG